MATLIHSFAPHCNKRHTLVHLLRLDTGLAPESDRERPFFRSHGTHPVSLIFHAKRSVLDSTPHLVLEGDANSAATSMPYLPRPSFSNCNSLGGLTIRSYLTRHVAECTSPSSMTYSRLRICTNSLPLNPEPILQLNSLRGPTLSSVRREQYTLVHPFGP